MYVLPIYIVWNLQMPTREKVALAALLCVGLVAVAGSWSTLVDLKLCLD
jgi:hypothetical protein